MSFHQQTQKQKMRMGHLVGAICLGLALSGCDLLGGDESTTFSLPVARSLQDISVGGVVLDAGTGQPIANAAVTVFGADSDKVTNVDGTATTQFTTTDFGAVSFYVNGVTSFPADIRITVTASGYEDTGTTLDVAANGTVGFEVKMINPSNPPAGVAAGSTSGTADAVTGVVAADITVNSGTETSSNGSATITIPAGTTLTDAGGTPVGGTITATATYFNNLDADSMATFPGGLSGVLVDDGTGGQSTQTFISGSFAAFSMTDENGVEVKNFSAPVSYTIRLPKSTINPDTGVAVVAGDTVPYFTYDDDSGKWVAEGSGVAVDDGDANTFAVTVTTTHLSYFNLDWYSGRCSSISQPWVLQGGDGYPINLTLLGNGFFRKTYYPITDGVAQFYNAPSNRTITLTAFYNGQVVGSTTTNDMCSGGTINISTPSTTTRQVNLKFVEACEQNPATTSPMPSVQVYLLGPDSFPSYVGSTDANGSITLGELPAGGAGLGYYAYAAGFFSGLTGFIVEDGSTPLEITHTNSVVCDTHEPEITGTTGTGGTGSGGSGI